MKIKTGDALDEQVFADGIAAISVIQGTVRIDFIAYSPTKSDASGQPLPEFRQRIIMSAEAFLATAEKFQEAAQRLKDKRPPAEAPAERPAAKLETDIEPRRFRPPFP
ncbi:hypothetical protein FHS83_000249 [Rhizomicrobium palustre]|uniref:Uncharacterized protein n=1 Tax=Rhizomicrobium palustre TaxID=189966 RepID=A0A846MUR1_9PROT|nr:hypothetical protein [Rhizomicrobium palustre]NIK86931.1 hypothetical protein [Rhizomicrobium palustre]